jgi:SAM-dependent methyltransferase
MSEVDESGSTIPEVGTPAATQRRTSFGQQAEQYLRFRPGYPAAAYEHLLEVTGLTDRPADCRITDIGAGSGQLTAGFVERGCQVTAVEPDERMLEVLTQRLPTVNAVSGSAESLPVPDASADLLCGAQMWHWVDQDRALPEIGRVLRPGGLFALLWNFRDNSADWLTAMESIVELPDAYKWFRTNEVPHYPSPIGQMSVHEFRFTQTCTAEDLIGLVGTFSNVANAPNRKQIETELRELTATHPDLRGKETFEIPYVCKMYTATRDR